MKYGIATINIELSYMKSLELSTRNINLESKLKFISGEHRGGTDRC